MARTFTTTTTATDTLKTNDKGHAEAVFTVTNTTGRPVRGMARVKALDSTKQEWLQINGESERDFSQGGTQQFVVTFDAPVVTPPPGGPKPAGAQPPTTPPTAGPTAADKYSFRLDVALATNPDEDFTEGPVVIVELPAPKPEEKKAFPKWIFIPIAAVVLIGIGIGLYFAFRNTDVPVPKVVGLTLDEAKTTLLSKKLTPVEQQVQITGTAPAGQVIAQDPKPDSSPVPQNTAVNLTTEGEVQLVEVPDVTKRLIDNAKQILTDKGLSVVEKGTDVSSGLQPNQVVSQDPVGGTKVKPASTIELLVAVQRMIVVPDVVFKPLGIAEQQLTAAGLKFIEKDPELAPATVAPGNVKRQNPGAGTNVPPASTIELVAAAQPTTVPDVRGRRIAEAQVLLQQQGLDLGTVSGTVNQTYASIVVITSQDPAANISVARGARVNVSVPFICSFLRACINIDRIDIGGIRKLDPSIKQPLIMRKQ